MEPRLAVNHRFQLLIQPEMSEPRREAMEGVKGATGGGGSGRRGSLNCNPICVGFDRRRFRSLNYNKWASTVYVVCPMQESAWVRVHVRVHIRVSPGAWNASEQTGHISPTRSFVLLNAAHLSQLRPAEVDKRWAKAPLNGPVPPWRRSPPRHRLRAARPHAQVTTIHIPVR